LAQRRNRWLIFPLKYWIGEMMLKNTAPGPHHGQPILVTGEGLDTAQAAMLMVHGRGGSAADILTLTEHFSTPGFAYLAPQAAQNTWYPYSFTMPIDQNEPYLSSGLDTLASVLNYLKQAGLPTEKIMLLGFSQGACLSVEFVARNAHKYGGVAVLSGGLIGPEGTARDYAGSLASTPVFLGCSDVDFHIAKARVQETTQVLRRMGADVTERLYPDMAHTINEDEIDAVRGMMADLLGTES
jgi:predicted esterase